MSHSEGPWTLHAFTDSFNIDNRRVTIANVKGAPGIIGEANANLIAAAPLLLETLTMILTELETLDSNYKNSFNKPKECSLVLSKIERIKEAINKATGAN